MLEWPAVNMAISLPFFPLKKEGPSSANSIRKVFSFGAQRASVLEGAPLTSSVLNCNGGAL